VDPQRVEKCGKSYQTIQRSILLRKTREAMNVQVIDTFISRPAQRVTAYKMHLVPLDQRITDLLDSHVPWIVSVPDVADNHEQHFSASLSDRYISHIFAADDWIEN